MTEEPVSQYDKLGILTSALCIVHCAAVPLVLAWNPYLNLDELPFWDFLQFFFALISFWAVYHVTGHTENVKLKIAFWIGFAFLLVGIYAHDTLIGEYINYLAATMLIGFHLYHLYGNRKASRILITE